MRKAQPVFFVLTIATLIGVFMSLAGRGMSSDLAVALFIFSLFGWIVTLTSGRPSSRGLP